MAKHRDNRISEELKKEISDILFHEIKDPDIGFVSIVVVDVSHDLRVMPILKRRKKPLNAAQDLFVMNWQADFPCVTRRSWCSSMIIPLNTVSRFLKCWKTTN